MMIKMMIMMIANDDDNADDGFLFYRNISSIRIYDDNDNNDHDRFPVHRNTCSIGIFITAMLKMLVVMDFRFIRNYF